MNRARRAPLVVLAAVTLGASGASAAAANTHSSSPEPPGSTADAPGDAAWAAWFAASQAAGPDTFAGGAPTASLVEGNRVLMIGDSIMASTARRYGGESCANLVPLGWAVEVDAETGRFVDFGGRVLDARLDAGFDVGVVMLGNNYGADRGIFADYLRDIVDELAPRPTILYTVSMYAPDRADVNDVIYEVATDYPNVRVIDWSTESADHPELLGTDGLHLTDLGRARFAEMLADELGPGPFGDDEDQGDCLSSSFTDDSATAPGASTLPGQAPAPTETTTGGSGGGSPTTTSGSGSGGTGGGTTSTPASSVAPTSAPGTTTGATTPQPTAPQPTTPQPTQPQPTAPQPTAPQPTAPPTP